MPRALTDRCAAGRASRTATSGALRKSSGTTLPVAHPRCSETLVRRSGVLVGEDGWGNKYYENRGYQVGA